MKKFNIGDTVYVSSFGRKQKKVECLVCYGKRKVTLILGNGEEVELSCRYCTDGLGTDPKGYELEIVIEAGVRRIVVEGIEINHTADGEKAKYRSDCYIWDEDKVFATEDEAMVDSQLDAEEDNIARKTRAEFIKYDVQKSYPWNAGYHMRAVKQAKKDIEYHSKMAVLCKSKAKENK